MPITHLCSEMARMFVDPMKLHLSSPLERNSHDQSLNFKIKIAYENTALHTGSDTIARRTTPYSNHARPLIIQT